MGWGLKRGGWVVVGVGALALVSGSAFAATEYMNRASIESTSRRLTLRCRPGPPSSQSTPPTPRSSLEHQPSKYRSVYEKLEAEDQKKRQEREKIAKMSLFDETK